MSKKTLIIIIAILAVILLAGIITIFVLPSPTAPNADAPVSSTNGSDPANADEPAAPEQEVTTPEGDVVAPADPAAPADEQPAADDPAAPAMDNDPTSPTKNNSTSKDPTSPTEGNETTKDPTTPTQNPTTPTQPPQATEPEETGPLIPDMPEVDVPESGEVTYEEYYAMSAEEQASFINSFESYAAFFEWHKKAQEEYESGRVEIDGSTPIDLGDITGGN